MEHNILQVIALAEKLKYEMRHSWLSNGRQESVAEHTWRMSLMAILVEPYLDQKVNIEKLLKMVIIHDLVEAEAGDIPVFDTMNSHELQLQKQINEQEAILNIKRTLKVLSARNYMIYGWSLKQKKHTKQKLLTHLISLR